MTHTTLDDEVEAFMLELGYELRPAEKDHRRVTRYEHVYGELQNISRSLAKHIYEAQRERIAGLTNYSNNSNSSTNTEER